MDNARHVYDIQLSQSRDSLDEPFVSRFPDKEQKECGHFCFPSSTPRCCKCMDLRPDLGGNFYPVYIDGKGWADEGNTQTMSCPLQK